MDSLFGKFEKDGRCDRRLSPVQQAATLFDRLLSGIITVSCACFCSLPLFSPPLLRLCLLPVSLLSEQSCKRRSEVKRAEVTQVPEEETHS